MIREIYLYKFGTRTTDLIPQGRIGTIGIYLAKHSRKAIDVEILEEQL